jgi:hypothetical protein
MKADYVKIRVKGASSWTMIANPFDIDTVFNKFSTYTIMSDIEREGFRVIKHKEGNRTLYNILLDENVEVEFYNKTKNINSADYVVLPYDLGNDFVQLVKGTLDKNGYIIVNEKRRLERIENTTDYTKYDNTILGIINYKHIPKENPKYDGDMNTLCKIYNKKAFYLIRITF